MNSNSQSSSPELLLQQAHLFLQDGQLSDAAESFKKVLSFYPKNTQILTSLGAITLQLGNFEESFKLLGKSLKIAPTQANAHYYIAIGLSLVKKFDEALKSFNRAIALNPNYAEAYDNRGNVLHELNRYDDALASYERAIVLNPNNAEAYNNRGVTLNDTKRFEEALTSFDSAIVLNPNYAEAYNNQGNTLKELKRFENALACYDRAIALNPRYANAHYNRGGVLNDLKCYEDAIESYDHAIALNPNYAEAFNNRGSSLYDLRRYQEALESYDRSIELNPSVAKSYYNRGIVLYELKRYVDALASYGHAISLNSDYPEAFYNSGLTLAAMNRYEDAVMSFSRSIKLKPDYVKAFNACGITLSELRRYEESLASFDKAVILDPDFNFLYGNRLHARMHLCDWAGLNTQLAKVRTDILNSKKVARPFDLLALIDDIELQRKCAELYLNLVTPTLNPLLETVNYPKHDRICIGYFSADFHNHATMHLMAELFDSHDKTRFELIAFSFGPDREDAWRKRAIKAFDKFIDVRHFTDKEVALLARSLEIDIAIDLKGFTAENRIGIFAERAAPIQVNYLGYPGTMGAEYIDYLIADRTLITAENQQYYSEKIAYLPNSYQANIAKREVSDKVFTRLDFGLPQTGFVFCCFNNVYKITPSTFDSWMQILMQVEGSVLWLYSENACAIKNLRMEAVKRGVDSSRLIFGAEMRVEEHLARLKLADLFLDTLPYNAHTTASDALYVGLPLLTSIGESFAARVAASLLNAVGLPELITSTPGEYVTKAVLLATNTIKFEEIRQKLLNKLPTSPLYDIKHFTSNIESAYLEMYSRNTNKHRVDHIYNVS